MRTSPETPHTLRIVTGGQTGVDQLAWERAAAAGLSTGGVMPLGFATEAGPRPDLAGLRNATQHTQASWEARTRANVRESDATLVFVSERSGPGTHATLRACAELRKPLRAIRLDGPSTDHDAVARELAAWIHGGSIRVLNVAGDRASVATTGELLQVGRILDALFERLTRPAPETDPIGLDPNRCPGY